jgi:hypothetical protein
MSDGRIRIRFSVLSEFDIIQNIRQKSDISDIIRIRKKQSIHTKHLKFIYITKY